MAGPLFGNHMSPKSNAHKKENTLQEAQNLTP